MKSLSTNISVQDQPYKELKALPCVVDNIKQLMWLTTQGYLYQAIEEQIELQRLERVSPVEYKQAQHEFFYETTSQKNRKKIDQKKQQDHLRGFMIRTFGREKAEGLAIH